MVSVGDLKFTVLAKCGEPVFKELVEEKTQFTYQGGLITASKVMVEEWVYDMGPGSFYYLLTFEGSKLVKIELAGRNRPGN